MATGVIPGAPSDDSFRDRGGERAADAAFSRFLPPFVTEVLHRLGAAGFEAYLVGGAVRDILLDKRPSDWDVATSAQPSDVCRLFPHYRDVGRRFGTITVLDSRNEVEVTTFRGEGDYLDRRHPSAVRLGVSLAEDLGRRDFTINAMAWSRGAGLIDPYGGRADLRSRRVKAVGDARKRFREDALRVLRAARFAATLCFKVDGPTKRAMRDNVAGLSFVARERLGPELDKLLAAPARGLRYGLRLLCATGALKQILPELASTYGVTQNAHHRYSVWHHTVLAVTGVPNLLPLRWAALLHDIGKVETRSVGEDGRVHFYGHEGASAETAAALLRRLAYPRRFVEAVTRLVKNHMFPIGPDVSDAGIRRLAARVGPDNMPALLALKRADLRAKGKRPTNGDAADQNEDDDDRLERYRRRVECLLGASGDGVPAKGCLALDGGEVMRFYGIGPGPAVGRTLDRLYEAVLDDPSLNTREGLRALLSTWPPPR